MYWVAFYCCTAVYSSSIHWLRWPDWVFGSVCLLPRPTCIFHVGLYVCCICVWYCNMVGWAWWDWDLYWKTNHPPSVLWHCWLGHL